MAEQAGMFNTESADDSLTNETYKHARLVILRPTAIANIGHVRVHR